MREVNSGGLRCILRLEALSIPVPFAECLQSSDGICKFRTSISLAVTLQVEVHAFSEPECRVNAGEVLLAGKQR